MHGIEVLIPTIELLLTGIVSILLARRLGLSPIVGYLVAGIVIGPSGYDLIHEDSTTRLLAELGVVFLMYDIGLNFSLSHVWAARRDILGLGPLQVGGVGLVLGLIGIGLGLTPPIAFLAGATLALSSTAVGVQILAERNQQHCPVGLSTTAVLVFQDVCAIFLLIFAASLAQPQTSLGMVLGAAAIKGAIAFLAAVLVGRYIIGTLFRMMGRTRSEELFTAVALLVVLVTAAATGALGLSLTLGAFLGGMAISETPYRHLVRTEAKPFRGLLMGFFFISIGMSLNIGAALQGWPTILAVLAGLVLIKAVLTYAAARMLGIPTRTAVQLAMLLSQVSEFAFVILAMPALRSAIGENLTTILVIAVAASLAVTPALSSLGNRVARRLAERDLSAKDNVSASTKVAPVVIFGMGEVGRRVADALGAHAIDYLAVEMDHDRFVRAEADGYPVAYGDLADLRLAETLDMADRPTAVVTINRYEISRDLTPTLRERYPNLKRFVGVDTDADRHRFDKLGMVAVVNRSVPKGIDLAAAVLRQHQVADARIEAWMRRQQDEALHAESDVPAPGVAA